MMTYDKMPENGTTYTFDLLSFRVVRWMGLGGFDLVDVDTAEVVASAEWREIANAGGGVLELFEVAGERCAPEDRTLWTSPAALAAGVADHLAATIR
jgi:hypothetical protein